MLGQHKREKTASDSRLKITNQLSLLFEIQQIRQRTADSVHRHLLVVEMDDDHIDVKMSIRSTIQQLYPSCLSVAGAFTTDHADRPDQISRYLGTEHQAVLFDATRRFDPGLLAAVASTVIAGGLMVVLTRALARWSPPLARIDPITEPATGPSGSSRHELTDPLVQDVPCVGRSRFMERFIAMFKSAHDHADSGMTSVHLLFDVEALPARAHVPETNVTRSHGPSLSTPASAGVQGGPWQEEQEQQLLALLGSVRNHEARVHIVEAKRGRGKSSLLGRLAARLEATGVHWQSSSPRRLSVVSLERQWRLEAKQISDAPLLPWVPADQVKIEADTILFVDEAADVPLPRLLAWAAQCGTLILATTTQGYEGSGRGFSTRLYPLLTGAGITWKRFTLEHPIRFGRDDPLEAFIDRVLLLDANAELQGLDPADIDIRQCKLCRLLQDDLLDDENRLSAVFGLLREAHYQTTPMDLLHLLEADNLRLYAITQSSTVLAVAMTATEGGIPHSLHEPIMSGRRRLKDQLLPQVLAGMANQPGVLDKRYLRIVRIAVAPQARRLGLGSQLLNQIEASSHSEFDAMGASYSQDHQTASFWRQCGFTTFHEGFRAHPRSGQRTAAVLRTLKPDLVHGPGSNTDSNAIEKSLTSACAILQANRLTDVSNLEPASKRAPVLSMLASDEGQLILRFSQGARTFHDTRAALLHLWELDPQRQVEATLDSLEMAACSVLPSCSGRKRREAALRDWARDTVSKLSI